MIRIGPSRWFVSINKVRERSGLTRYHMTLTAQARKYVVLSSDNERKEVTTSALTISEAIDSWDAGYCKNEARLCSRLADELALEVVDYCERSGILYGEHVRKETIYIAKVGLMQHAQRPPETHEQIDVIDLVADQLAAMELHARHEMELEMAHRADMEMRKELSKNARVASMKLLYENLTPEEAKEARNHGRVTVKTGLGDFVVPVNTHGLVRQYVDGEYIQSYCVVPAGMDIPVGDEALQKIIYLKKDLAKLVKASNRFKERLVGAR